MAVDAPEGDRRTVQSQNEITNFDTAEADFFCDDFAAGIHDQGVEDGIFRAPQRGLVHVDGDRLIRPGSEGFGEQCFAIRALQCEADRDGRSAEFKAEPQFSIREVLRKVRFDNIVDDALLGTGQNIHVPEDPREAELVLVLQITSVAPFENKHSQKVFALFQEICDVELSGVVGDLAVADEGTVEPHVEA